MTQLHELLPHVDAAVHTIASALGSPGADGPVYVVDGDATTGKTALLMALRDQLGNGSRRPLLVSPPAEAPEVGVLALLELHGELENAGLSDPGVRAAVRAPHVSWSDKLLATRRLLREHQDRLVLLLDEPSRWRIGTSDTPELGRHAMDVYALLVNAARCPRVITGPMRQGAADRTFRLTPAAGSPTSSAAFWGRLAPAARELLDGARERAARRTPLELRLLVALAHLEGAPRIARWVSDGPAGPSRREIARRLSAALAARADTARLVDIWTELALERRPFDMELLREHGYDGLSPDARDILSIGLLYEDRDGLVLHEMLRGDVAGERLDEAARRRAHERLAAYHRRRFETLAAGAAVDRRAVLVHEAECWHHTVQTGDLAAIERVQAFFVDQLNILGRTLSREFQRHDDAMSVYRRVLEHDAENAYATHYLAYNLDVQGKAAPEVSSAYARSLELESSVDRWHAHWVGFLITRGRTVEARAAWDRALDAVTHPGVALADEVFAHLHEPVLRLLIHRAVLDFARTVLESVPRRLRTTSPSVRALERQLDALSAAAGHQAVFPLSIAPADWWSRGPHLCPWRHRGRPLSRWLAARVDAVDRETRELSLWTVRGPTSEGASPSAARLSVPFDRFDSWCENESAAELEPGRFLEMAVYDDAGAELLCCRVHPAPDETERDLPPLWPRPDRYLAEGAAPTPAT